jgi:DNA-binding NarL/FixJ family response regulator
MPTTPASAASPQRVLVVEDSQRIQSALVELLETLGGFQVAARVVGESEATDWIHHHPQGWDLAIVDLVLENGSGFHLLQRMRREHADGRVVIFSEFVSPALHDKCMKLGAQAAFRKSELQEFIAWLEANRPAS